MWHLVRRKRTIEISVFLSVGLWSGGQKTVVLMFSSRHSVTSDAHFRIRSAKKSPRNNAIECKGSSDFTFFTFLYCSISFCILVHFGWSGDGHPGFILWKETWMWSLCDESKQLNWLIRSQFICTHSQMPYLLTAKSLSRRSITNELKTFMHSNPWLIEYFILSMINTWFYEPFYILAISVLFFWEKGN